MNLNLAELKAETITLLKQYYTDELIYGSYPIWKQANIIRAGGAPLTTMESFIDGLISDVDSIETDINALAVTDMWSSYAEDTDANLMTYVFGYLAGLDTDEKKLAVALSVRRAISLNSYTP